MVFWMVVAVVVLVGLGLALRADRKRRGGQVKPDSPGAVAGKNFAMERSSPRPGDRFLPM